MSLEKYRRSSVRKLNFTDRTDLRGVAISVKPDARPLGVALQQLEIPASIPEDASITVEAYRSRTGHFERLHFGEVGPFRLGGGAATRPLSRIPDAEDLRFRVKIAHAADGRLLAEADGLRSIEEQEERSVDDLFPLREKKLDGELWRVAFTPEGPELWVEKALSGESVFLWKSLPFHALVLPQAMHVVAERLIRTRERPEEWHERWRTFLCGFYPAYADLAEREDDDETEADDADIDAACNALAAAFSRKFELVQRGVSALQEEEAP